MSVMDISPLPSYPYPLFQYWPKFCYKVSCDDYIHSWKFEDYDGNEVIFDNLRNNGLEDCTEVLLPNFLVGWVNE